MGISGVQRLCWRWYPQSGTSPLEEAINAVFDNVGFTGDSGHVGEAISSQESGRATDKSKVIKDKIWGMVEVDPLSIRLLDSPVLQRLRGIKQLGFSYLTYPSAEHSRFIHSLGMYCVVSRFLDAIARPRLDRPSEYSSWQVPPVTKLDLLHAAILHDIGHTPFSHATEKVYASFPDTFTCGPITVSDFTFAAEECLDKELALAECLSLAVVLSPRFRRYYTKFVRPDGDLESPFRLSALIAGIPPRPELRGIAELISDTAVDADKVDYINRDSDECGIPVGIDVARLFLRSDFVSVAPEQMYRLRPYEQKPSHNQVTFIVNSSGVDTIEELTQARAALYHRVYLHQTTRNAERLLGQCLETIATNEHASLRRLADVLEGWALDDFAFLDALRTQPNKPAANLARRLRERHLPKRACAFGRSVARVQMPLDEIFPRANTRQIFREITGATLEGLRWKRLHGPALRSLEVEITDEAGLLARRIKEVLPEIAPTASHPEIVAVLPMQELEGKGKNCIVLENNQLIDSPSRTISNPQGEAVDIFKAFGYVMTDLEWREIVFFAAQTVLSRRTQSPMQLALRISGEEDLNKREITCIGRIILDSDAVQRRTGISDTKLMTIRTAAEEVGYFDDQPLLAPLRSDPLQLGGIAEKLSDFRGQGDWHVTRATCEAFLCQFPPKLRKEMQSVLEKFVLLDRISLVGGLRTAIWKAFPEGVTRGHITALSPDSGNFVRMMLEHELRDELQLQKWSVRKSIDEVFRNWADGDALLLCDDMLISGNQAECQFLAWSGIPRDEWPHDLQGEHGIFDAALGSADLLRLRAAPVAIVTASGTSSGDERLRSRLGDLKFDAFLGVHFGSSLPSVQTDLSPPLEEFLVKVGASVLSYCRLDIDDLYKLPTNLRAECESDALGYASAKGLVGTLFNVPPSTLTALWCPGLVRGAPWMPLFIRRGYLKHLVVA